jgi:hypothetical protein
MHVTGLLFQVPLLVTTRLNTLLSLNVRRHRRINRTDRVLYSNPPDWSSPSTCQPHSILQELEGGVQFLRIVGENRTLFLNRTRTERHVRTMIGIPTTWQINITRNALQNTVVYCMLVQLADNPMARHLVPGSFRWAVFRRPAWKRPEVKLKPSLLRNAARTLAGITAWNPGARAISLN